MAMDSESMPDRLSRIVTQWSVVCQAHSGSRHAASAAQLELLGRYGGAIERYLGGALRDADAAAELSQEFALRFIRGDFHNVSPERGRFRDYVKTVLFRMVANYQRERGRAAHSLEFEVADPHCGNESDEEEFLDSWRRELLHRAWLALEELERNQGQPYHTLLKLRLDDPEGELTSGELAAFLESELGRKFTADGVRKLLQRAREKFAELLLENVLHSLNHPTGDQLEHELRDLGLLAYCRAALGRREGR
jgi:RNA polymerase sigma-70 factor (ECF subfamily)